MSFNGAGTFQINSTGQPVVSGTVISDTVFNALTADLATGLSNCITKDGQQTVTANIPMAGFKFTGMGLGSATTDSARMDNALMQNVMEGRLGTNTPSSAGTYTPTDGSPIIYLYPYKGNKIALYNGTQWVLRSILAAGSTSLTAPATTNTNYDVFAYDNSGTVTLESTAWASDTTRASALTFLNGVFVKSADNTRRYIGTYRTGGSAGQVRDTPALRYVWNYYNRLPTQVYVVSASTWTYTTATFRQANGSASNQLDFVIGIADDTFEANVVTSVRNATTGVACRVGIGVNGTTDASTMNASAVTAVANIQAPVTAYYRANPSVIGRVQLTWLEYSQASGITTWNDTATGGIFGTVWM